jgi:hypothetical protein
MFKFFKMVFGKKDVVVLQKDEYNRLLNGIDEILTKVSNLYNAKLFSVVCCDHTVEETSVGEDSGPSDDIEDGKAQNLIKPTYMSDVGEKSSFTRTT